MLDGSTYFRFSTVLLFLSIRQRRIALRFFVGEVLRVRRDRFDLLTLSGIGRVTPDPCLIAMQQVFDHLTIVGIGGRDRCRMNQAAFAVHPNRGLHAEVPWVALFSRVHFRVARRKLWLDISADTVIAFAKHRCRCAGGRRRDRVFAKYVKRVLRLILYLETQDTLRRTVAACGQVATAERTRFRHWLTQHRGVLPPTVRRYQRLGDTLLLRLGTHTAPYTAANVRAAVLDHFRGCAFAQRKCITTALRAYLKFLVSTGACSASLEQSVPTVAQWRLSSLPRYLPAEEVDRVINACDTRTKLWRRDRAAILLMVRLGLRASDIVNL